MSRSTLPRHRFASRYQRTSAEGGGGGTSGGAGENQQTGAGENQQKPEEKPEDKGFPENTPVAEMTDKQQAAYWRHQSKTQQARVPKNLDELQQKAAKWEEHEKAQQTPAEKAIEQAKLEGKREMAGEAAMVALRVILQTRGKEDAEISDLLDPVNSSRFITEAGLVDHQKVTAYADKIAPVRSGGGGSYGQGRFEQTRTTGKDAGMAEARRRGYVTDSSSKS